MAHADRQSIRGRSHEEKYKGESKGKKVHCIRQKQVDRRKVQAQSTTDAKSKSRRPTQSPSREATKRKAFEQIFMYVNIWNQLDAQTTSFCPHPLSVQLSGELTPTFCFSLSWTLRRSNPGLDFASSQGIGLCVVPHVQDWTLRHPSLDWVPSYLLVGAGFSSRFW